MKRKGGKRRSAFFEGGRSGPAQPASVWDWEFATFQEGS
jgi:hypothetical protein